MNGLFITVEGGEGAGKSTILRFIEEWLSEQNLDVVITREPGGTPRAEQLRDILLDTNNHGLDERTELLLVFAARADHLEQRIRPALAAGKVVLCDRFTDATYAYQGGGRGLDLQTISTLERLVHGELQPTLTLLLDVPVDLGLKRAGRRGAPDRIEQESIQFFERVRTAYLERARQHSDRFAVIDSSKRLSNVVSQVRKILEERLGNTLR